MSEQNDGKEASGVHGDAEEEGDVLPLRQQAPPCEQCGAAASKYRCPGCGCRTCSLGCVNTHKSSTGCSGKRDRTAFVGMKEFDDKALLSDFRLLEEIGRADDVARRCRPPAAKPQLPAHLASLVYQGSWRSVKLLIMPPGMAKRKANTTRYDARNRTMFWRVEWRFPGAPAAGSSGCIECVDERVDEKAVVGEVLAAHLRHPAPNYVPLRPYAKAGLGALRVFMRKEKTPANAPAYFPIDTSKPLASQLASRTIIEYPVFIVALPHEAANYPPPPMLQPPPRPAGQQAGHQQGAPPQQQGVQGAGPQQPGTLVGTVQPPPPPPPRRPQPAPQQLPQVPLSGSGLPQAAHPQAHTPLAPPTAAATTAVSGSGVGQDASYPDQPHGKRPRVDGAEAGGNLAAGKSSDSGGAPGIAPTGLGSGPQSQGGSAVGSGKPGGGPPPQDENEIELDVGQGLPEGLVFYYGDDSEEEGDGQPGAGLAAGVGSAGRVGDSGQKGDENEIVLDDL